MINPTPPLTFEDKIRAATKAHIPLPSRAFQARLQEQLLSQPVDSPSWHGWIKMNSKKKTIRAIGVTILVLALIGTLLVGPQNVMAAFQNLLRYIPGIGFVQTDRFLSAPVTIEREGTSLTVDGLVVTEEETVLVYYAQGLTIGKLGEYCETQRAVDPSFECLRFEPTYQLLGSDGTVYMGHATGGGTTDKHDGTDWTGRVVFSPIPPGVLQVDFMIDILPNMYPGMAPEDWIVPLQLQTISEVNQLPAIIQPEYSTLTPEIATQPAAAASPASDPTPPLRDEVQLLLDAAAIQENTLTLSISIQWQDDNWHMVEVLDLITPGTVPKGAPLPHHATLVDAKGNQIPLVFKTMESPNTEAAEKKATYIFSGDISGQELAPPLTLTLSNINVTGGFLSKEEQPSFLFTPSVDFQPGTCEEISQTITLFAQLIEFIKVCSVNDPSEINPGGGGGGAPGPTQPPPHYGLELHTLLPPSVRHAFIGDKDCQREQNRPQENCGASYVVPSEQGVLIEGQLYYYQMPDWPVAFTVTSIDFVLPGPWSIQFDLSELTPAPSSSQSTYDQETSISADNETAHLLRETIPDGTVMAAGDEFIKIFTLENTGATTWNEEYQIVLYASPQGETLGAPQSILLGESVHPGEEVLVSIPLTAPENAGEYTVVWQLLNPDGEVINVDGGNIWVTIQVSGE